MLFTIQTALHASSAPANKGLKKAINVDWNPTAK
jgi:hypothetical protein